MIFLVTTFGTTISPHLSSTSPTHTGPRRTPNHIARTTHPHCKPSTHRATHTAPQLTQASHLAWWHHPCHHQHHHPPLTLRSIAWHSTPPLPSALCPLPSPSALCPLPSALCPLPSAPSALPLPSALCPLPSALYPLLLYPEHLSIPRGRPPNPWEIWT